MAKNPLRKLNSEEEKKLTPVFNALVAELKPALDAHKDEFLGMGMYYDEKTYKATGFYIVLDEKNTKDVSDIPATVGKDKLPVKLSYAPRP